VGGGPCRFPCQSRGCGGRRLNPGGSETTHSTDPDQYMYIIGGTHRRRATTFKRCSVFVGGVRLGVWCVVLVVSVCVGVGRVVLCRCVCVCDLLIFSQVAEMEAVAAAMEAARAAYQAKAASAAAVGLTPAARKQHTVLTQTNTCTSQVARTVVAPPSSVVKCLWGVFVWGVGVLFLSCVCVGVGRLVLSMCVCVCVCVCVTC